MHTSVRENTKISIGRNSENYKSFFFQPKLTNNQSKDIYEHEADKMADKVMRMSDNSISQDTFFKPNNNFIQCKCTLCEKDNGKLQRKENNNIESSIAPPIVHEVLSSSSGKSLDSGTRSFFEPRFGHDFSNVKIHTDSIAAKSADNINALAYTSGNNIVFNKNQYSPETNSGKKLLAHELTHTIQQRSLNSNYILKQSDPSAKPEKGDVWGFPVTKSMCGCSGLLSDEITWAKTAASSYAACDIPANSSYKLVEVCFKKAHPEAVVVGSTSSSGIITPPAKTDDPCEKIINHSTLVHETMHKRHADKIAMSQGTAFYTKWLSLDGDKDRETKMKKLFPKETAAYDATFFDGHDWAQDEVNSYTWEQRFLNDAIKEITKICT